jgi:hypothetical protein
MSTRFAEKEHRRAKGVAPLENVAAQIEALRDRLTDARRVARELSKDLRLAVHALDELQRDISASKKVKK